MASIAQTIPGANGRLDWLWQWLRAELKPYPGRVLLVVRMVTAATLVMIICMTFRIPYAFQGAAYALFISRESPRATLQSAATVLLVTGIGAAHLLVSARFVINVPLLHFLWFIGSLFLAFYAITVLTNYTAAVVFAIVIAVGVPLWDRHVSAETNVEDTLWLCLAALIGITVTAGVELAVARLGPRDEVVLPITERLSAVENLLNCYADGRAADPATEEKVIRLEMLGTSLLRRILCRSDHSSQYSAMMGSVAVLVGRLVDLAAALTQLGFEPSASDQRRFRHLALTVASIRNDLMGREVPAAVHFDREEQSASVIALLGEMEDTVTLIPQAFTGSRSIHEHLPPADDLPRPALFAADALVNSEHLKFALKGCLAASNCYVIYNAIAWPGISTAVMTCLLTALSTIGASRQKQMLRVTGALADGVLFEFGPSRHRDLELRSYIRLWQPELLALFVMRIASLKYRLQWPGFELPETVRLRQEAYDDHSARLLEEMADCIEHNAAQTENIVDDSHGLLKQTVQGIEAQLPNDRVQSLITLLRGIDGLTTSLASEIAAELGRLREP
jgi:multidrug resistance protein MdtO